MLKLLTWSIKMMGKFTNYVDTMTENLTLKTELCEAKRLNATLAAENARLRDNLLGMQVFVAHMNGIYADLLVQKGVTQQDIRDQFQFDN